MTRGNRSLLGSAARRDGWERHPAGTVPVPGIRPFAGAAALGSVAREAVRRLVVAGNASAIRTEQTRPSAYGTSRG